MNSIRLKVGLICGGTSGEHQVSLISAYHIQKALDRSRFDVQMIGINQEGSWFLGESEGFLEHYDYGRKVSFSSSQPVNIPERRPLVSTEKKIIGTLYQDMYSRFFFRNLKIITDKKNYIIDFEKNIVLENKKIIKFKDSNSQMILLKKNLKEFIKKIKKNDYSLKNFDNSVLDLKNCLKMHIKI